ncbi:MAG: anti-sigma factor [Rhizobiales bacterium]|nr:anti-sigma factor [Hyphomicrobiales bacterium]
MTPDQNERVTLDHNEKDVLAAEYVLGTLDSEDRANVEMLLALDSEFAATVAKWERRLGELSALVESVDPPSDTWEWVKVRIAGVPPSGQMWLPGVNDPPPSPPAPAKVETAQASAEAAASVAAVAKSSSDDAPTGVATLSRDATRWRALAAISALAAALLLALLVRPDFLPESMRPAPKIVEKEVVRTVEVPSPKMAEYVAALRKNADPPAFLVTLDMEKRTLSARMVSAPAQAGKNYELWMTSKASPEPQSLGVVGEGEFTVRRNLAAYDAPMLSKATFMISLEPAGGSTTGKPSGPPMFTGKLMQLTPPAFPSQTP